MNKEMRALLANMDQKRQLAKGYIEGESKDLEKATAVLDEIEDLEKEFAILKRLFEAEKEAGAPTDGDLAKGQTDKKADGFAAIAKFAKKQRLTDAEKALIVGGANGENYLLPEDVRLAINELRRQYVSAKDLVTINPTDALTGSFNYEAGEITGLVSWVDGEEVNQSDAPKFTRKNFTIGFHGKLIPVSNLLAGAEKAGLMGYLNRWFVKNAVYTENNAIFAALKKDKTAKAVVGWEALKESLNIDLDPACLLDAVIVTNQTGFNALDQEKFADGRPVLQANPANPTQKLFQGLPVRVFSDAQLHNVGGKAPMFYGSLKAGAQFMDYQELQFATSTDYLFGKNQTALRVIEGFDVHQTDSDAYIYATFAGTPATLATQSTLTVVEPPVVDEK